jgi:hypothetical protein
LLRSGVVYPEQVASRISVNELLPVPCFGCKFQYRVNFLSQRPVRLR